jgi:hypothetical protein
VPARKTNFSLGDARLGTTFDREGHFLRSTRPVQHMLGFQRPAVTVAWLPKRAQQSRLVSRPSPFRDRPQRVQLGVSGRVRVLHGDAPAKLDVLADGLTKCFILWHASFVQGRHVELNEARTALL